MKKEDQHAEKIKQLDNLLDSEITAYLEEISFCDIFDHDPAYAPLLEKVLKASKKDDYEKINKLLVTQYLVNRHLSMRVFHKLLKEVPLLKDHIEMPVVLIYIRDLLKQELLSVSEFIEEIKIIMDSLSTGSLYTQAIPAFNQLRVKYETLFKEDINAGVIYDNLRRTFSPLNAFKKHYKDLEVREHVLMTITKNLSRSFLATKDVSVLIQSLIEIKPNSEIATLLERVVSLHDDYT